MESSRHATIAAIDLAWTPSIPAFQDRTAAATITIGTNARVEGRNVVLRAQADASKFAHFVVDTLASLELSYPTTTAERRKELEAIRKQLSRA